MIYNVISVISDRRFISFSFLFLLVVFITRTDFRVQIDKLIKGPKSLSCRKQARKQGTKAESRNSSRHETATTNRRRHIRRGSSRTTRRLFIQPENYHVRTLKLFHTD